VNAVVDEGDVHIRFMKDFIQSVRSPEGMQNRVNILAQVALDSFYTLIESSNADVGRRS